MSVVCVSMLIFVGIIDVEKAPLMMSVAFALKYVLRYYLCVPMITKVVNAFLFAKSPGLYILPVFDDKYTYRLFI